MTFSKIARSKVNNLEQPFIENDETNAHQK